MLFDSPRISIAKSETPHHLSMTRDRTTQQSPRVHRDGRELTQSRRSSARPSSHGLEAGRASVLVNDATLIAPWGLMRGRYPLGWSPGASDGERS